MEKKYASLKEKIAAEKAERFLRDNAFASLLLKAERAGYAAGDNMTPRPMSIVECDAFGKPVGKVYVECEGMCGFASVIVRHANKGFGRWLIKSGNARKSYYGGAEIWIHAHNQSYERKVAHANAMVKLFNDAGFESYTSSRLD